MTGRSRFARILTISARQTSLFLIAVALVISATSGCASRASDSSASAKGTPPKAAAPENLTLTRKPVSDIPEIKKAVDSALEQTQLTFEYDPAYVKLTYPGGDVPIQRGVCADVIIRAFRNAGVDLQKELHEDITSNFRKYPDKWGARRPDSNIDHRRVPNLMTFFGRAGKSLPTSNKSSDYLPGDVVAWQLDNELLHIGLVTDAVADRTENYQLVHNIGAGAKLEDVLFSWKIIGHYRMWKQR
jgi:uncharacterized protein